jgi:hypothetical protein
MASKLGAAQDKKKSKEVAKQDKKNTDSEPTVRAPLEIEDIVGTNSQKSMSQYIFAVISVYTDFSDFLCFLRRDIE